MDETKRCSTCGAEQPVTEFNRRALSADGLQARCRSCNKAWYQKHRAIHIKNVGGRNLAYRQVLRAKLADYLTTHSCVDCGEVDIRCLHFDHRDRSTKKFTIARMLNSSLSWASLLEEIKKCDVRCANCHSRKTAEEINSWRHQLFLLQQTHSEAG